MDPKRKSRKRAVVPHHLKERLIKSVHGGPLAGHFSNNRLYNLLVRSWWWDSMYGDVTKHCKNCPQCAFASGAGSVGKPPLQPIPVQRPFQIIGVDIMDLPKTERGNKHVLVFQYDRSCKVNGESSQYKIGQWVLIRHPQEESGPNRKLSRPWHGPFRITGVEKTGVTAERVYGNSAKDPIRVHLQ